MSQEPETETKEEKKPSNKMIPIIGGIVGLCAIGAGVIFFTPLGNSLLHKDQKEGAKEEAKEFDKKELEVTFLPLPELTVNLKSKDKPRILRGTFVLSISNEKEREHINHFVPVIIDQFNTFLREMEATDLQGAAGIERVSQEMLVRINQVTTPLKVKEVLVKDFLIQ